MTLYSRFSSAWQGALAGWARHDAPRESTLTTRDVTRYQRAWDSTIGIAWADAALWASLRDETGLYSRIRQIHNPGARVVSFYASAVYPGRIPEGDEPLPPGVREAIPLVGASDDLVSAIRQVWQYSQWQAGKNQLVEATAAVGETLVEIVDDVVRGRVAQKIWWPGYVKWLEMDDYGNVRGYELEYPALDSDGKTSYTFNQRVDKEWVTYMRNGVVTPPEGQTQGKFRNPWGGLIPACWVRHRPLGRDVGLPAVLPSRLLDEINALASRLSDYLTKQMKAPVGVAYDGVSGSAQVLGGGDSDDFCVITMPGGSARVPLAGDMEPAQALAVLERDLAEFEALYPEMSAYSRLRDMGEVSGVAVERLLGDVVGRLDYAQSVYDTATRKMAQMAVAIGGMRANAGDWGDSLTAAQAKFLPFSLDSYAAGDLDFAIMPRPLTEATPAEKLAEETARAAGVEAMVKAGLPFTFALRKAGYSEEEIAEVEAAKAAEPPAPTPPPLGQQSPPGVLAVPVNGNGGARESA